VFATTGQTLDYPHTSHRYLLAGMQCDGDSDGDGVTVCTQGITDLGETDWDGVIDRDYLKHRSQKLVAKRDHAKSRPTTANGKAAAR
jgi:hypothetical protein